MKYLYDGQGRPVIAVLQRERLTNAHRLLYCHMAPHWGFGRCLVQYQPRGPWTVKSSTGESTPFSSLRAAMTFARLHR